MNIIELQKRLDKDKVRLDECLRLRDSLNSYVYRLRRKIRTYNDFVSFLKNLNRGQVYRSIKTMKKYRVVSLNTYSVGLICLDNDKIVMINKFDFINNFKLVGVKVKKVE